MKESTQTPDVFEGILFCEASRLGEQSGNNDEQVSYSSGLLLQRTFAFRTGPTRMVGTALTRHRFLPPQDGFEEGKGGVPRVFSLRVAGVRCGNVSAVFRTRKK